MLILVYGSFDKVSNKFPFEHLHEEVFLLIQVVYIRNQYIAKNVVKNYYEISCFITLNHDKSFEAVPKFTYVRKNVPSVPEKLKNFMKKVLKSWIM